MVVCYVCNSAVYRSVVFPEVHKLNTSTLVSVIIKFLQTKVSDFT